MDENNWMAKRFEEIPHPTFVARVIKNCDCLAGRGVFPSLGWCAASDFPADPARLLAGGRMHAHRMIQCEFWWSRPSCLTLGHERGIARRMHGSLSETDDAVQEAWLRFSRLIPAESRTLVLLPAITVTYFGS